MGLGRGSLYDTFGDKHSLYLAALSVPCQYQGQTSTCSNKRDPSRGARTAFFKPVLNILLSDPARRGCFLVNATVEMAPHDPEVNRSSSLRCKS